MENTRTAAIAELKAAIEKKQNEWRENDKYDGCMAQDVLGMMLALNCISGAMWGFKGEELVSDKLD